MMPNKPGREKFKSSRSYNMSRIRYRDTKPEILVRQTLWRLGYRYRLHTRDLPGTPDIVFRSRRKAIFVHGCFWHRHPGCKFTTTPKTNKQFWLDKFAANVRRDAEVQASLIHMGFEFIVIWECETRHIYELEAKLKQFMASGQSKL